MKKFLAFFMLPLIAVAFSACDDDDDVMNTKLIKGQWQLVTDDTSNGEYICNFTTQSENTWSWGMLATYYFTKPDKIVYDKSFSWHVSDPNNYETVYLDITFDGDLDSNDASENTVTYIVEKLSKSEMVLRTDETGNTAKTLHLIRRNDLPVQ